MSAERKVNGRIYPFVRCAGLPLPARKMAGGWLTVGMIREVTRRMWIEGAFWGYHDPLEERVRERTAGLAKANEELKQEVAERVRTEEALRQRIVELEALNEELESFAHTAAHSLQGPLGLSVGFAEFLEQDYGALSEEEIGRSLRTIVRSGLEMSQLIDELLLLAGVRKKAVDRRPLDMAGIVAQARRRLAPMIEEYGAEITWPETWPAALGYGPWVEEVWVNYLSNAIKYGGRPPRVELGFDVSAPQSAAGSLGLGMPEGADGMLRFWISDNGPGLTVEERTLLFRPFTRLDRGRAKGHGLGLSIVRRIVEKLGGQVEVESKAGGGSVFAFTLPAGDRQ